MRIRVIFPISIFILLLLSQCGPSKEEAMNFHKQIIKEQHLVVGYVNEMIGVFSTYDPAQIESALEAAKLQVEKSIRVMEELEVFENENELYSTCMDLFYVYRSQLNNEYAEQLEIYKLPYEEYTIEKEDRFNELNMIIDEKFYPIFDKFSKAEEDFAKKWDFELIPADL